MKLSKRNFRGSQVWWFEYITPDGKRFQKNLGDCKLVTQKIAESKIHDLLNKDFKKSTKHFNLMSAIDMMFAMMEKSPHRINRVTPAVSKQYIVDRKNYGKKLLEYFGNINVATITQEKLQQYKSFLESSKYSVSYVNKCMLFCKQLFRILHEDRYIQSNPMLYIRLKQQPRHIIYWTDEEVSRLLEVADDPLKIYVNLAVLTGMRRSEILRLEVDDIDWVTGTIQLTTSKGIRKGKSFEIVYLHQAAQKYLKSLREAQGCTKKVYPYTYSILRRSFEKARKLIGVDKSMQKFRNTFGMRCLDAGIRVDVLQELYRHKDLSTTQIYAKVHNQKIKDELNKLKM